MEIYNTSCLSRATDILRDSSHPEHHLFELLPFGGRYGAIKSRTDTKTVCILEPLSHSTWPYREHSVRHVDMLLTSPTSMYI